MVEEKKDDNVVFIFDEARVKKPGDEIAVECSECKSQSAVVLHAAQQPFYEEADEPVDVVHYLLIRCNGKRCEKLGLVEQMERESFRRVFPAQR